MIAVIDLLKLAIEEAWEPAALGGGLLVRRGFVDHGRGPRLPLGGIPGACFVGEVNWS